MSWLYTPSNVHRLRCDTEGIREVSEYRPKLTKEKLFRDSRNIWCLAVQ